MFKILVLQSLYNLSDHQIEFPIKDRLSLMQFLGLRMNDRVPDEKTVWAFRERLKQADLLDVLFEQFHDVLDNRNTNGDVFGDAAFDDESLRDKLNCARVKLADDRIRVLREDPMLNSYPFLI